MYTITVFVISFVLGTFHIRQDDKNRVSWFGNMLHATDN